MPEQNARPCGASRRLRTRTLALAAIALSGGLVMGAPRAAEPDMPDPCAEPMAPERCGPRYPWYHVEVLVFLDTAGGDSAEWLGTRAARAWPAATLALAAADTATVQPRTVGELQALWQGVTSAPHIWRVPAGLSFEAVQALDRIEATAALARDPRVEVLKALERYDLEPPTTAVMPRADAGERARSANARPEAETLSEAATTKRRSATRPRAVVRIAALQADIDAAVAAAEAAWLARVTLPFTPPVDAAWREVPQSERLLAGEARALERSDRYRVLGWVSWRQPFQPAADPRPVMFEGRGGTALRGVVGVRLQRYLHLEVDLWLDQARYVELPRPAEGAPAWGRNSLARAPGATPPAYIRMRRSRRLRSGELYYLDHPLLGVLARIEPYAIPESPDAVARGNP